MKTHTHKTKLIYNMLIKLCSTCIITHSLIHCYNALTKEKTEQREMITTHNNCDDDDAIIDDDIDDNELDNRDSIDYTNQKQETAVDKEIKENLSQYELARMERIKHHKQKFKEILGKSPKDEIFLQRKNLRLKK